VPVRVSSFAYRAQGCALVTQSNVEVWSPTASLRRADFFSLLAILGCANGLFARALQTVNEVGWADALLGTFGISAIVWISCFIALSELLNDKANTIDGIRPSDWAIGAGFLVLVSLPIGHFSWLAVTGLGLYILVFANTLASRRRGALILLATTVPMLWSRVLFNLFANLLLEIDASLVAWLLGTSRTGNMVRFANDDGYLVVLPACSSVANMSLSFLCWMTACVWLRHRWSPQDILWGFLACGSVAAVNVGRLSLMGLNQEIFEIVHGPWGEAAANVIMLALALGFTVLGVRRELFSRA
jgi:hypothetical protein